ncbi:hypothetical protein ACFWUZ_32020 [Streptomyces sp. NPDC058646]|uniref:hypothetical protein n=1 Tax=Streptomyces sp. NPDC058646 TaxID=3346574 RepID=UPI0036544FC5
MAALAVLCVALAGAGMACLWFYVAWWLPAVLAVLGCLAGWALFRSGRGRVPINPRQAMRLMEWKILLPGSLAAAGAAGIILVEVYLQTKDSWTDEAKTLVTALSAAVTTAIGALFVKGAETYEESWLAEPIKKAFQEGLKDTFQPNSPGDLALYNRQGNWDRTNREKRLKVIEVEVKNPTSPRPLPPPSLP